MSVRALFAGYSFYLKGFSAVTVPTKSEVAEVVKAAGGNVISNLPLVQDLPETGTHSTPNPSRFKLKTSLLGRKYLLPEFPVVEASVNGKSDVHHYALCFPDPKVVGKGVKRKSQASTADSSTGGLKMPYPSKAYPLIITPEKRIPEVFPPAPEDLSDLAAPHSWVFDCISARAILPIPYLLQD